MANEMAFTGMAITVALVPSRVSAEEPPSVYPDVPFQDVR